MIEKIKKYKDDFKLRISEIGVGDELRQLRTAHQQILDAAGEGIYGLDSEGRTTFGNAATIAILSV